MPDDATEVTAAGIARLAGVGRAAVSNWRRRHADFPRPVGGTDASPRFALAEVEGWLRAQGKLDGVPPRERVWQLVAGHADGVPAALTLAGAVLLLVRERPARWAALARSGAEELAYGLAEALPEVLAARFGAGSFVSERVPAELGVSVPLLRAAAGLAAEFGEARAAYEFLLGRYLETNPRQHPLTPPQLAELIAALAGPGGAPTVLDPAAGTGTLLLAAPGDGPRLAQDVDPESATLAALRLALHSGGEVSVAVGDTLRADGFAERAVDLVVCHPPFNERNWGHEELAYDPRFGYGLPARTESELAWVQHALARLRDGGTAVLVLPPAVAARRSGRRIRADLLRRGALRAVIALPPGAAPPYGVPLHLWILRRPSTTTPPASVLLIDAGERYGTGRDTIDWPTLTHHVTTVWREYDRTGTITPQPAAHQAQPVVTLLDDDVDVTPARHLPPLSADGSLAGLNDVRDRLAATLRTTVERAPGPAMPPSAALGPLTTVGELARAGALTLRLGGSGAAPAGVPAPPVLSAQDVLAGGAPSAALPERPAEEPVLVEEGDVVVPVVGAGRAVRVVDTATAGAALGRNLALLRPDPRALDPWFLAGLLRGAANARQASSHASSTARLDVRRMQVPRMPLAVQRSYGEHFRALAAFESALREAGRLGERLMEGLYDGLAAGSVGPG
ncbi:N-6 DNA methylase [Streptomyces sp. NPDC051940]|uniref:N-6 DNA methylase n=1 Tax=Streptomyces sp. NPDC051940 TaxID=3155675 RepID=UPI003417E4D3